MGMSTKATSARNLQKAINENLVTVKSAKVKSKDDYSEKIIQADQFKSDLDFYMKSGVFADTLDCKYELSNTNLTVYIGNMSNYCDSCITVDLIVNDGVDVKTLEKIIKRVENI